MRIIFAVLLGVCVSSAPLSSVDAANYDINLIYGPLPAGVSSSPAPQPWVSAPTHTSEIGYLSPIFYFSAGDSVDFGTVTIAATGGEDGRYNPIVIYEIGPAVAVSYNPSIVPNPFTSFSSCSYFHNQSPCSLPTTPDLTEDLVFTFQEAGSIELAFSTNSFEYVAPAVPEPSTWAMLLIGFAGIGFVTYHRHQFPKPEGTVSA